MYYFEYPSLISNLIKPTKLFPGDTVAAISLSSGEAEKFPYRFNIGKDRLEKFFQLQVITTKHAFKSSDWLNQNPKARSDDLMDAFSDKKIKAIISIIGGSDSIKLLPFIDFNVIKSNPKIFMGYSDTTIIHFICIRANLCSFYGPAIMTAFAENVKMHNYTMQSIHRVLFSSDKIGVIPENNEGWTTEILNWNNKNNQNVIRLLNSPVKKRFIGSKKIVRGRLIGGCFEVLQSLDVDYLRQYLDIREKIILFIEISGEPTVPEDVTTFIVRLKKQTMLHNLNGILFSKPGGYGMKVELFNDYDKALLQAFQKDNKAIPPIVTCMDFGHSDPMFILPYGVLTEINPIKQTVTILESCLNDT